MAAVHVGESARWCAERLDVCKDSSETSGHESADFVLVVGDMSQANRIDLAGLTIRIGPYVMRMSETSI